MMSLLTRLVATVWLFLVCVNYALADPPSGIKAPGNVKTAPASASNPKESAKGKQSVVHLYPASAQETADSILADSLGRLVEQTDEHFHQGEYNHCINLNRIVVQGDPHNVDAYGINAWLLWSTARSDEAIAVLKQGIAANPNTYYMYDEMGSYYQLHLKDSVSAQPYFEQAVKCKDCTYLTWHSLAHCYEKTGQWDKAVFAWESAAKYVKDTYALVRLDRARAERDKHKADPKP